MNPLTCTTPCKQIIENCSNPFDWCECYSYIQCGWGVQLIVALVAVVTLFLIVYAVLKTTKRRKK